MDQSSVSDMSATLYLYMQLSPSGRDEKLH